jgi:hypothetical protein
MKRAVRYILLALFITLFITLASFYYTSNAFLNRVRSRNPINSDRNDVTQSFRLAIAIPVGGTTNRTVKLKALIERLLFLQVNPADIYLFHDNSSNQQSNNDAHNYVSQLSSEYSVNYHKSNVNRDFPEPHELFGLYLAEHYNFMLDTILLQLNYDYILILEDDLFLTDDAIAYFNLAAATMAQDNTLWCATGHTDNAFYATSPSNQAYNNGESKLKLNSIDSNPDDDLVFPFRRGQHFMAPGFMTSARVYKQYLQPFWFNPNKELSNQPDKSQLILYHNELHMPNGNW